MDTGSSAGAGSASERFAEARARLGGAQKSKAGVPAYLRYVNRRLGGWIASVGYALGRTPDQLTAVSAAWSLLGIAAIAAARPTPLVGLGVAACLLVGYAFDSADGQLSRLRGGGSRAGEWLDHVVDVAKTASLHAAVVVSWFRWPPLERHEWLLVPLAFGIVNITFFFGMMLRDQLGGKPAAGTGDGSNGLVKSLALLPMDYGVLCLSFCLLGFPSAFAWSYAGLLVLNLAFAARSLAKARRTLAAG